MAPDIKINSQMNVFNHSATVYFNIQYECIRIIVSIKTSYTFASRRVFVSVCVPSERRLRAALGAGSARPRPRRPGAVVMPTLLWKISYFQTKYDIRWIMCFFRNTFRCVVIKLTQCVNKI